MTPSPINVLLGLIICTPPHLQTNGLHALDFMGRCWRCKNISFLILRIFIAQYISLVYFQIFGQQRMQQNGFSHIRNYILLILAGFSIYGFIASAKTAGSNELDIYPIFPFSKKSIRPPTFLVKIGSPKIIASKTTVGIPSV